MGLQDYQAWQGDIDELIEAYRAVAAEMPALVPFLLRT